MDRKVNVLGTRKNTHLSQQVLSGGCGPMSKLVDRKVYVLGPTKIEIIKLYMAAPVLDDGQAQ